MTEQNAHKRNEQFRDECRLSGVRKANDYQENIKNWAENARENGGTDVSPIIINQYIRMMNWVDIDGAELLQMQERPVSLVQRIYEGREEGYFSNYHDWDRFPTKDTPSETLEWWGIEEAFFYLIDPDTGACGLYYPQLFYGRWIPIDTYGMEDEIKRDAERLQELRESGDCPPGRTRRTAMC